MSDISLSLSGGIHSPSAKAFIQFVEFLDDQKPPMFVENALSYVLRTEPPIYVTMDGLISLIRSWAEDRSAASGRKISELFLSATGKIIDAYRSNAIRDFDPRAFYRPFTEALLRECPEAERESFEEGLRSLMAQIRQRWERTAEPQFEETDAVEIGGRTMTHTAAAGDIVGRLERAPGLTDAEFDEALSDLDRVLVTRAGTPVRTYLERLVGAGVTLLNAGVIRRAAQLFALADGVAHRFGLGQVDSEFVWSPASADRFEPAILARLANDASHQPELGTIIRCVPAFGVEQALYALEHERSRDRRRFLLKVLELHGGDALKPTLDRLGGDAPWYFARNLVYVLSRIEIAFDADRRRVVERVTPYVTSEQPQLRSATLALLKRLAGQGLAAEVQAVVARALDPRAYAPTGDAGRESLFHHACQVLDLLAASDADAGLEIVAEVATGDRGGEFQMGKALRDHAIAALGHRRAPLPRRPTLAIAKHLRQVADRRLGFVTGRLGFGGVDLAACRSLLELIQGSPEPEVRDLLETPAMRRMKK